MEVFTAGVIVNFGIILPILAAAGLTDNFDWSLPRDSLPYFDQLGFQLPTDAI